uniref:Uncharacterized protein n=1 Tax=Anthurium amnicola TaxID=1678845 RepID=A0A1D1Y111_9ARAE
MSSERTDQLLRVSGESDVEAEHEPRKTQKLSYTREFLLFLSELDACQKLPPGFDSSVLSEFEDASSSTLEWQRSLGGPSLQGSKRNDYGSSSLNRAEGAGSYSRGSHGRWDTHSTGSSDRDGEAQTDLESLSQDSGRRYSSQYRRPWQKSEHDGLLGSGGFPRPSGYQGWASTPKGRGNGNYQLNKSSEPYQPPRLYKAAPYSRKDSTDSYNDETFGSSECSSLDRAEEERKRRASFELMRQEQQKVLQEKQKQKSDNHKENFDSDIIALLENSEVDKSKSNDVLEKNSAPLVSQADFGRYPLHAVAPASRPLVPPGFASSTMEKNQGGQLPNITLGSVVGNVGINDNTLLTKDTLTEDGEEGNAKKGNDSVSHAHSDKSENSNIAVSFMDAVEPPSTGLGFSDSSADCESTSYDTAYLLQTKGGWKNDVINDSNVKKITKNEVVDPSKQDHSASILDKLFGNALTNNDVVPKSVEGAEVDEKTWSTPSSRSSKFASWFLDDDKMPAEDVSSRDLLSLIVRKNTAGSATSAVSHEHVHPNFPLENSESGQKFMTSTATPSINGIPELYYHNDNPVTSSNVLTCEDLEQSILAGVKESSSSLPDQVQEPWSTLDSNFERQKTNVDDQASQHLLSLLHKGTHTRDVTSSSNPELMISSGIHGVDTKSDVAAGFTGNVSPDNAATVIDETGKSLTLEALFGSAFMKELRSMEAPISQKRGSDGDCIDTSVAQPYAMPSQDAENRFFSGEYDSKIIHKESTNHMQGARLEKLEESWIGFDESRTEKSKLSDDVGYGEGPIEIHLPEEDSLIAVGDSADSIMRQFFPVKNVPKADELLGSRRIDEIVVDKLASLNVIQNNERYSSSVLNASACGPYDMVEPEVSYQHLHGQSPSPQFSYSRMNHMRSYSQQLDNPSHKNPQINFIHPENVHHDPPHPFLGNIIHPHPVHNPTGPRLDPPFHPSMAQPALMPGNFPPHHLQYFPRGVPLSHPLNRMLDYMPEAVHSLQRQPNYGGYGIGMPGTGVHGPGGNHPETLGSLTGGNHPQSLGSLMEMNANSQHAYLSAAGHHPGIYDPEHDMGFRYR